MPPRKDEHFDDVADTRTARRRRVWEVSTQAQPPHNLPQREEGLYEGFSSDEYPAIPRVRRASLYRDPYESSYHHPAAQAGDIETEHVRRISSPQRRVRPRAEPREYDETRSGYSEPRSEIVASQRRRSQASSSSTYPSSSLSGPYPPSRPRDRSRMPPQSRSQGRKRQTLWPFAFLPPFVQRHNLLTVSGFTIVFMLVFLVVSSLLNAPIAVLILPGLSASSAPTDPHKLMITPVKTDHPAPPVYAQAAYLLDADTGATLYAHNPFMHLPVMSTTKLMTALLAVERGNLDQTVTINGRIVDDINKLSADSSIIDLKPGESYTLRQLMYGLLLASGNDAAIAIADTVGGSYANFIAMMNQKVKDLGLHDSHFENPHGLQQPNHYSSSHDLAIIGLHSLGNPTVHQISGTLNYHIDQTSQHPAHDFFNGNQLLWWYPGIDAGKPGYDAATNFVQVVSCVRNNHRLIGVTIHTIDWWTDMRSLMNWGFNTYTWVSPRDLNTPDHPIPYAGLWNNFERDKKENTVPTADKGRYYIYTGYSITGDIANYFDKNGGITSFGFPLSQPSSVENDTLRQRFERSTIQCNIQSKRCQKGN